MQAQLESRKQHDEFHKLLGRSPEPFSLVAEYFGRGLFNRIVIFDENELKRSPERRAIQADVPILKASTAVAKGTPALAFGTGAEAKMRVAENRSHIIPAPQSEARMRLQEQQRSNRTTDPFSSSLEANIDWSVARSKVPSTHRAPVSSAITRQIPSVASPKAPDSYPTSSNPFGEDDEVAQPPCGNNPFGEAEEEVGEVAPVAKSDYNPFDEDVSNNNNVDNYDQSLNPFDD